MDAHKRRAEKAGSWYPDDPEELKAELERYLERARLLSGRPAGRAEDAPAGHVIAGVVPHAGLYYSGAVAARTFCALQANAQPPQTILLFGAVHTMSLCQAAVWPDGSWSSPLGALAVDAQAAQQLLASPVTTADPTPHLGDNALELQIPFLRYCFPDCAIVPVAVPPNLDAVRLGQEAARIFRDRIQAGSLVALASTDLTHYGSCYGFAPAGEGATGYEWSLENDRRLLRLALELRAAEIVPLAMRDHSACGAGALAALTAFAATCGSAGGTLLEHTTSREVAPERGYTPSVGYASLIFRV